MREANRIPETSLLEGLPFRIEGEGVAADYAAALLRSLGGGVERRSGSRDPTPACEWARSGAMALTGWPDGPALQAPGPLASCARGALRALDALAPAPPRDGLDAPALLGERAAIRGLARSGSISPGGSCRMLRAADGWIALNLARPDDLRLLPAWLEETGTADPWRRAAAGVQRRSVADLAERARLLGLPLAVVAAPDPVAPPWLRVPVRGPRAATRSRTRPVAIDLSSLWAGPLCAQLLLRGGARVVKVESTTRPDGARFGPRAFFDLLHGGKPSVALHLETARGRERLRALIARADLVVESARPRALAQLGIDASEWVRSGAGRTWISLTGYGRGDPEPARVAFGDDAAVAAGVAHRLLPRAGTPVFCGDALADPLTGLHAALAALASWRVGGGHLLDLSLRDVTAHALAFPMAETTPGPVGDETAPAAPPRARRVRDTARPLGRDTEAVLRELAGTRTPWTVSGVAAPSASARC